MSINKFKISADKGNTELELALNKLDLIVALVIDDDYSIYDAIATDKDGLKYIVETKHRNAQYKDYIMEYKKLQNLNLKRKELGLDGILYVNTFKDNKAIVWSITQRLISQCRSNNLSCPRTTAGNNAKIDKLVIYLPTNLGIAVNY